MKTPADRAAAARYEMLFRLIGKLNEASNINDAAKVLSKDLKYVVQFKAWRFLLQEDGNSVVVLGGAQGRVTIEYGSLKELSDAERMALAKPRPITWSAEQIEQLSLPEQVTADCSSVCTTPAGWKSEVRWVCIWSMGEQAFSALDKKFASLVAGLFSDKIRQLRAEEIALREQAEREARHRELSLIFENVQQGFLLLDTKGILAQEHSKVIDEWFASYEPNTEFSHFMEKYDPSFADHFSMVFDQLADSILSPDLLIAQLPTELSSGGYQWEVSYSPLMQKEALYGVLVVITDVTKRLALERREAEQRDFMVMFKHITQDRFGFLSFYEETSQLFDSLDLELLPTDIARFKHRIHTIKGNCAIYGLKTIAERCHEVESLLQNERFDSSLNKAVLALKTRWQQIGKELEVFQGATRTSLEIGHGDYTELLRRLRGGDCQQELLKTVESWQLEPFESALTRLGRNAQSLARRLGCSPLSIEVDGAGLRGDAKLWRGFWSAMAHVIRNAIGHGFISAGVETPLLQLKAKSINEGIEIEISDNGGGIQWDLIAHKAHKAGLASQSREDLVAALFSDGLSVSEQLSETSGRGVGMGAVKKATEALGGSIGVLSEPGEGTSWFFRFPSTALVPPQPNTEQKSNSKAA